MKLDSTILQEFGTSIYAGGSAFFAIFLHGSYSTYMQQLGVRMSYSMENGFCLGLISGLSAFFATFLTLTLFVEKDPRGVADTPSRVRALLRASIVFVFLIVIFFVPVALGKIPQWYDVGLLYLEIVPALIASGSAYLNHRFRAPHYKTNKGLEHDHRKLLQGVNTIGWLVSFYAATTVMGFFYQILFLRIPAEHMSDQPATILVSFYTAAAIFLVAGMGLIIIGPLLARLGGIEALLTDTPEAPPRETPQA